MKQVAGGITKTTKTATTYMLDTADVVTEQVKQTVEARVSPLRQTVLSRYPVLFSFLVMFGVATTYYAFEKILGQYEILNQYPWLILGIGLSVLAFTGKLYKKLQ